MPRIIWETIHESTEFASPICLTTLDGGARLILNLKNLKEFVKYDDLKWLPKTFSCQK